MKVRVITEDSIRDHTLPSLSVVLPLSASIPLQIGYSVLLYEQILVIKEGKA